MSRTASPRGQREGGGQSRACARIPRLRVAASLVFGPWPGLIGDHVAEDALAGEHQVADHVERLVAGELVVEAHRLLAHHLVAADHDGIFQLPPLIRPLSSSGLTSS
jgi:hypothetical protein